MNKYLINYKQSGGTKYITKLRLSICNQATNIISHLLNALFIPNNRSLWNGTDFYHLFGNQSAVLNLKVVQLEYMISSINHKYMDASYSAKISLVKFAIDRIFLLKDSLLKIGSDFKINSIGDITRIKINCDSKHVPYNFNSPIQVQEIVNEDSSNYSFSSPIPPDNNSITPYNISSLPKKFRCIYRDSTCMGDRDVITLEDIGPNNIRNIVKVDKKCYNADELQKWLVNNSTLPHNRQPYTSKELNACVEGKFNQSPLSISSPTTTTIVSPSLLSSSTTIVSSPYIISPELTPFIKNPTKFNDLDFDDDELDFDDDELDDGTETKFISSFSNMSKKKTSKSKKSSKKKTSKSKKKTSKSKKSSKKKTTKSKKSSKKRSSKNRN